MSSQFIINISLRKPLIGNLVVSTKLVIKSFKAENTFRTFKAPGQYVTPEVSYR